MIAVDNFVMDVIFHFLVILLISQYIRYIGTIKSTMSIVFISFIIALFVSYVNHTYFPRLRLPEKMLQ
jgi:hypothetical protein